MTQLRSAPAARADDLLRAGEGIAWENRGSVGVAAGFVKTVLAVTVHPLQTLDRLRRPETRSDATAFLAAIAGIWFIATLIHGTFDYYVIYNRQTNVDLNGQWYCINTLLEALAVAAGAFLLVNLAAALYHKIASLDAKTRLPPVLVYNMMVYAMAPSWIALIPGEVNGIAVGPCVAVFWIFVLWIALGTHRLRLPAGGAIIGAILTFVVCLAIAIAAYYAISIVWTTLLGYGSMTEVQPLTAPHSMPS